MMIRAAQSISKRITLRAGERPATLNLHNQVTLSPNDLQAVATILGNHATIQENKRSKIATLQEPIPHWNGNNLSPIDEIYIKGVIFNEKIPKWHQGLGLSRVLTPKSDGRLVDYGDAKIPQGAMRLSDSINEFIQSHDAYSDQSLIGKTRVRAPIGWGTFPNRTTLDGKPLGFVLLESIQAKLAAEFIIEYGKMLGYLHSAGFLHPSLHLATNANFELNPPAALDLERVQNRTRNNFTPEQFIAGKLRDLIYVITKATDYGNIGRSEQFPFPTMIVNFQTLYYYLKLGTSDDFMEQADLCHQFLVDSVNISEAAFFTTPIGKLLVKNTPKLLQVYYMVHTAMIDLLEIATSKDAPPVCEIDHPIIEKLKVQS